MFFGAYLKACEHWNSGTRKQSSTGNIILLLIIRNHLSNKLQQLFVSKTQYYLALHSKEFGKYFPTENCAREVQAESNQPLSIMKEISLCNPLYSKIGLSFRISLRIRWEDRTRIRWWATTLTRINFFLKDFKASRRDFPRPWEEKVVKTSTSCPVWILKILHVHLGS